MQKGIRLNDVAIVSLKGNNYRNHFWCMSKCEAINIMKNSDLTEKQLKLKKRIKKSFFHQYLKDETKRYYESNKGRLQEQSRNKYR